MPRGSMRQKADLPQKICVVCGRPFSWRKKWARDWEAVQVCSERCRRLKRARPAEDAGTGPPTAL